MSINSKFYKKFIYKPGYYFLRKNIWSKIDELKKSQVLSIDQIHSFQLSSLREQCQFCFSNIPYYQDIFSESGFNPNCNFDFDYYSRNVPILTKEKLREVFEQGEYSNKVGTIKRQTSGSSGNPLTIYKDSETVSYIDAAMYRNLSWYGIDVGTKRSHFWGGGGSQFAKLRFFCRDLLANWRRFDCFKICEQSVIDYTVKLNSFNPIYVYGYAKSIYEFAVMCIQNKLRLPSSIQVVIVTGEKINSGQKETIKRVFQAKVIEEYGCTECGIIAFECPHGSMHLMSDMLHAEIEYSNVLQTKNNKVSGNVILSELRGSLFPLLRYRIGDRGVIDKDQNCTCNINFPLISHIEGREDDLIFLPNGTIIDAFCIEKAIQKIPENLGTILKIKGVQKEDYDIDVYICGNIPDPKRWVRLFNQEIYKYTEGVILKVHFVESLQRERSGKLKYFVSKVKR